MILINIFAVVCSCLALIQNLIHLVAKDEKVTAVNDLVGMSNHKNISKSEAPW